MLIIYCWLVPTVTIANEDYFDNCMNDNLVEQERSTEKVEISISLDPELLEEIKHLTNNPSKTIEAAVKQWLKGERAVDGDLTRTFRRNPPLPPRGEWND